MSPVSGDAGNPRQDEIPSTASQSEPQTDDQPTIISSSSPIQSSAISGSAHRIFQGKILPGDRLGHFQLFEFVGGGGMGRVFRAVDTSLGRTVALKILAPDQALDKEVVLRFQNEARSAARLDHPNIARVHYVGEDRGLNYIAFEFVEGVNIRRLVEQKGALSLGDSVGYVLQIAEALVHSSQRNVVHRDIKPSNLLITPQGHVKLIDMGLARLQKVDTSAVDLTASGVTLGTFDYISPEQARDPRNADIRSDIYSLGCTFFYMLAGRPPFPEGTVLQKLLQHQGDQPPDIREFRPDLPEEVTHVLRRMLAKDPRRRYRDPDELIADLLPLAKQMGLQPVGPGGHVLVAPRETKFSFLQRHLPWIAPIAALACIVLLLEFLSRRDRTMLPPPANPPAVVEDSRPESNPKEQQPRPIPDAQNQSQSPAGGQSESGTAGKPASNSNGIEAPSTPAAASAPADSSPLDSLDRLSNNRFGFYGLRFDPFGGGLSGAEDISWLLGVVPDDGSTSAELTSADVVAPEPGGEPTVEPAPKRSGILVVGDAAENEDGYSTLAAACSAAGNGDIIELHYSGRGEKAERPIRLANLRVEIRAGKGYRPVVLFQPDEIDPIKYPRSMFTVESGRLTMKNVALELNVPREVPAEDWCLFETRGAQTVNLQGCSLTVRNASDQFSAYHARVSFFRCKSAPGTDVAMIGTGAAARPPATVDLADCIARGEATLLLVEDLQPAHLVWKNGLLATTERLLSSRGGPQAPHSGEILQVDLSDLTMVVQRGLCRLTASQSRPHQLSAQIYCADSIVMLAPQAALIDQVSVDGLEGAYQQFTWSGDRNFYEGFDEFWRIRDVDGELLEDPKTFEAWEAYWGSEDESLPLLNQVRWKQLPAADRPLHSHTPADYVPAASPGANHVDNAGFQTDVLPELAAEPPEPEM